MDFNDVVSICDGECAISLKWFTRYSKKVHPGDVLVEYSDDDVDPTFFVMKFFIVDPNRGLLIFAKSIDNFIFFDPHYECYCILSEFSAEKSSQWKLFFDYDMVNATISTIISPKWKTIHQCFNVLIRFPNFLSL